MSDFYLPDAIPKEDDLRLLFRMAEARYWVAFDAYLAREGVLAPNTLTADRVREMIRRCVGADNQFVCRLCNESKTGWGHNPDPVVCEPDARCCDQCNEDRVIPQRIRDATLELAQKMVAGGNA